MKRNYTFNNYLEFSVWYAGLTGGIKEFYAMKPSANILLGNDTSTVGFGSFNSFWYLVNQKQSSNRIFHSSLPATIVDNITKSVFSGGFELSSNIDFNNEDVVDEDRLTFYEIRLRDTNIQQSIAALFKNLIVFSKTFYKIEVIKGKVKVKVFSPLQCMHDEKDPRNEYKFFNNALVVKVNADTKEETLMAEIYGEGYIRYSYMKKEELNDGNFTYVELTEEEIIHNDLEFKPSVIFKEKINLAGHIEFDDTPFEKTIQLFDAYDEISSLIITMIRKTKPLRFIAEELLDKDDRGETKRIDDLQIDWVTTMAGDADKDKSEIITSELKYDFEQAIMVKENYFNTILSHFGIDEYTIGMQKGGFDGAELSRAREAHTIRTFESYKVVLEPEYSDLINKVIFLLEKPNLNVFFTQQNNPMIDDKVIDKMRKDIKVNKEKTNYQNTDAGDILEDNFSMLRFWEEKQFNTNDNVDYKKILMKINDFIKPSHEDQIKIAGDAIALKVSDIKTQLKGLYPDSSEDELDEMKENIYMENNISEQDDEGMDLMNQEKPANDKVEKPKPDVPKPNKPLEKDKKSIKDKVLSIGKKKEKPKES